MTHSSQSSQDVLSLLTALRQTMASEGLDGLYIGRGDRFQGEEVQPCDELLAWISGFTGSAGAAVILADTAAVFSDQRYTLQMARQTDERYFSTHDITAISPLDWISEHIGSARLGIIGWNITKSAGDKMATHHACAELVSLDEALITAHWPDRPPRISHPVWWLDDKVAGLTSQQKRHLVVNELSALSASACLLTGVDEVNWLLNMRGRDLQHTPLHHCFAIIDNDGHTILIGADESAGTIADQIIGFDQVASYCVDRQFERLLSDPDSLPLALYYQLTAAGVDVSFRAEPVKALKARKNDAEIAGFDDAHLADGVAMVRFWHWLTHEADRSALRETDIADKLTTLRSQNSGYVCNSFATIAGMGANGAVVHYRAEQGADASLADDGVLLVDSGAHYVNGTTDITRCFALGAVKDDEISAATAVLAAHIHLALTVFPEGTTGAQLDAICRRPLWQSGRDYGHGTGHGVGHVLSVHEGPVSLSKRCHKPVEAGNLLSNEPGFYHTDRFGIRLENLVVVEPHSKNMLGLRTITLCPFDPALIDVSALDTEKREWVNRYHMHVYQTLSPHLDSPVATWLQQITKPL